MRLVPFLFATALAMCLVVGIALLMPEATGEHGFVHPAHASMSKAPKAFIGMLQGANIGKQLVQVSEPC